MTALEALRAHIVEERDFNEKWILVHRMDGHPIAAARRREVVAERQSWIDALDAAIAGAIYWALGESGDFPVRSPGEGAYWWRAELRKRALATPEQKEPAR